jgi:hypothetical protein
MKKLLLLLALFVGINSYAQQEVEARELTKKEIKALKKQKRFNKQVARYAAKGLNAYGINEQAINIAFAIRYHVGNSPKNGNFVLKPSASLSNGRTYPLWIIDGIQYDWPPQISLTTIREVRVLETLSEITKYGQQGRAGVIEIKTNLSIG